MNREAREGGAKAFSAGVFCRVLLPFIEPNSFEQEGREDRQEAAFHLAFSSRSSRPSRSILAMIQGPRPEDRDSSLRLFVYFAVQRKGLIVPTGVVSILQT